MRATHLRAVAAFVLAATLSGCASPALAGRADVALHDVVLAGGGNPTKIRPLLADDAEVRSGGTETRDLENGARSLAALAPQGEMQLFRHHDVSLLTLGDGQVVLIQRGEGDRIRRAIHLPPPAPGDGMPWQGAYYSKAWNLDDEGARLALLRAVFTAEGRYVDGTNDARGPQQISDMIGRFRNLAQGSQVKAVTGMADAGGGWLTWDWVITSRQGGRTLFFGVDVMHLDVEGKIDLVAGFVNGRRR